MLKGMNAEEVLGRDLTRVDNAVILGSAGTIMETFLHSQNVYGIETMGGAGRIHPCSAPNLSGKHRSAVSVRTADKWEIEC